MAKREPDPARKPQFPPGRPIWPPPERKPSKPPGPRPRGATPVDLQIVFGENLKVARERLGMSQCEFSQHTGLTQQYLSLVETGQKNLTLRTIMTLAEAVDETVSEMLRPRGAG
jgi:DNA-binding XRE family transcriptional regulator